MSLRFFRQHFIIFTLIISFQVSADNLCSHYFQNARRLWKKNVQKLAKTQRLPYCYYFEICELKSLPQSIRKATFQSLGAATKYFSGLKNVAGKALQGSLQKSGHKKVIELGSGSGHGLLELKNYLGDQSQISLVATDLFPNIKSWTNEFDHLDNIDFFKQPIAFEDFHEKIPLSELKDSTVLIISAFHHLDNVKAKSFFLNAQNAGVNILIIEPLERDVRSLLISLGSTFSSLLAPIIASKVTLKQRAQLALFHWVLPVVPMIFLHDGIVSTLRQRTKADWRELINETSYKVKFKRRQGNMSNFSVIEFSL